MTITIPVPSLKENWKSTCQSFLTATIGISGVFASAGIQGRHVGTSTVVLLVSSVAKVLLGVLEKD